MRTILVLLFLFAYLSLFAQQNLLPNSLQIPPFEQLVPADKALNKQWKESLTEKGNAEWCTGKSLDYVDMPVSGLFSGQVTLGGDGNLYTWDIFNDDVFTGWSGNYGPVIPKKPLQQFFTIEANDTEIPLDRKGFSQVSFLGEYPIGKVKYSGAKLPIEVSLQAFSPFIPLDADRSGFPLTTLNYTLTNTGKTPLNITLKGYLENFVCKNERGAINGKRINKIIKKDGYVYISESMDVDTTSPSTKDIVIEDWVKGDFSNWIVKGHPFNQFVLDNQLLSKEQKSKFQNIKVDGNRFISTYNFNKNAQPKQIGSMRSKPFFIQRNHLYVWMRKMNNSNTKGLLKLYVEGKLVDRLEPKRIFYTNSKSLFLESINLTPFVGKQAEIELTDNERSEDNSLMLGKIFMSDKALLFDNYHEIFKPFNDAEDQGKMAIILLDSNATVHSGNQSADGYQSLIGMLGKQIVLMPNESKEISFAIAWYFPNLSHLPVVKEQGRWYASAFKSIDDVIDSFATNRKQLYRETELWHHTWYESSLPRWFVNRTIIPVCNLASTTNYRLHNGRWWAWEGVGSCEGTCGHVYGYAQAVGRLFPQLERELREKVDFGFAQNVKEGWIDSRAENRAGAAIDAQGFYILRALREHQMTTDSNFIKRIWPRVKLAMEYMIKQDSAEQGVIRGAQHNTLDADWYGEVSWYNSIYLAALKACAEMALINGEKAYNRRLENIASNGASYMLKHLFNGEYFQNKIDSNHLNTINSGSGCEIDQVLGQSWAFQVGLSTRVLPEKETKQALQSLWKYNYAPNAGAYRQAYKSGRRYADAGEAGILMCTFPKNDWNFFLASGNGKGDKLYASYFNECMTGFEHQVAAHMICEGLITEGLSIEKSIHDRYSPIKRNPYNEVECGDYYGRAMASYGVFIAACGFEYDGPSGKIAFAPKINPEDFQAAFTSAEGWGNYAQQYLNNKTTATIKIVWGKLRLTSFKLQPNPKGSNPQNIKAKLDGQTISVVPQLEGDKLIVTFSKPIVINKSSQLEIIAQ